MSRAETAHAEPDFAFRPIDTGRSLLGRLAAVFEVMAIVVAMYWGGYLAAAWMAPSFNEAFGQILIGLGYPAGDPAAPDPDFTPVSISMLKFFAYQYGAVLAAVIGFAIIAGRRSINGPPTGRPRYSLAALVRFGLVCGCVVSLVTGAIFLAKDIFPLGQDTPFWWASKRVRWDSDFWLFMAIGSFVLVPIVEELTYRVAMLGRLTRAFSPGAAMLGIAILFSIMHSQYWSLGLIGYITLASVVFSGAVFGYSYLRTGSILPAIIAHAMINVPVAIAWEPMRIGLCLLVIVIARKPLLEAARRILRALWHGDSLILAGMSAVLGLAVWGASSQLGLDRIWIEAAILGAAVGLAILRRLPAGRSRAVAAE